MVLILLYGWISPEGGTGSNCGGVSLINAKSKRAPEAKNLRCPKGKVQSYRLAGLLIWPASALNFSLETVQDLVGPEPLEAMQRLVQRRELLVRDAADLLHRLDVLLVERVDDAADFLALRRQADAHRAAINARALMIEEAELDELLQIVGDVGAEIVTARAQLARGQLLVADVIEQQRLHRVDVGTTTTIELVLDDIEQAAMQPLHQRQRLQIERLHRRLAGSAVSGLHRRRNSIFHDTAPVVVFIDLFDETFVPSDRANVRGRFEEPLK